MTNGRSLSVSSSTARSLVAGLALLALPSIAGAQGQMGPFGNMGPRSLYVWDATIPADRFATKALVGFAQQNRISSIYIESAPVGYGEPQAELNYARLVDLAHARGVQVFALIGNPWFTVPADAGLPGQPSSQTEGVNVLRRLALATVDFDGVIDNSMPYLTDYEQDSATHNWFFENLPYSAQDYLDYVRTAELVLGDLPFHHAIPFWFDSDPRLLLALDASPVARPLNSYVSDIVDVVNVLAYRDHAQGPDGILAISLGELLTGPTTVGIETRDLGADLSYLTFWEEGSATLELELFRVWLVHRTNPNLRGFSLHHYGSYQTLLD